MPFKQQKTAAGYVPHQQLGLLVLKLRQARYETHDGPAVTRAGEIVTLRKTFDGGRRQNHVQLVRRGDTIAVYAHTEPHTDDFIGHAISALWNGASFAGGTRMLLNDLARVGFSLSRHAEARGSAR